MTRLRKPLPLAALFDWRPRADIPNTVGYNLTVRLADGREVKATVLKNSVTGLHYLHNVNEGGAVPIQVVMDWKPRNAN